MSSTNFLLGLLILISSSIFTYTLAQVLLGPDSFLKNNQSQIIVPTPLLPIPFVEVKSDDEFEDRNEED